MAASNGEIINVTVQEVWEMLNNEEDGKQIPVDVRTFQEYYTERIATPHSYDKPRLYPLQLIEIPIFATIFNIIFAGKDIILYCRTAHRSYIAAKILMDSGWNGNLYNMEGGITAWKAAGLPTVKRLGIGS
ncbi:MAG TPA: rhodanese-like domain-containing protein [Thermoplasmatales archaeon]|nr:rhodanese-like domain-containing protein [Thermoplasmatales archaeon]